MDNTTFKNSEEFVKDVADQIEMGIRKGMASMESHLNEKQQGDADASFIAFFMKEYRDYAFKASYKAAKKFIERCNEDIFEPLKFIKENNEINNASAEQYKMKDREQQLVAHVTSQEKLNASLDEFKQSALLAFDQSLKFEVSLLKSDIDELKDEITNDDRQLIQKKIEINKIK
ncbi:hypothetical protein pb186bvf_013194 [Paramecium bursaria]